LNRDYQISGHVLRKDGSRFAFTFESPHYKPIYKHTPFYERLFRTDEIEVTARHEHAAEGALISELRRTIPDYMVPSAIVVLPVLPRTPSGKLDRRALPAPHYVADKEGGHLFVAPRTLLEEKLAEIWQDVLGIERVSIHADFLEIGGESLLALRIVNRLRGMLSENVPLSVIFESPTIALLGETVRKAYPSAVEGLIANDAKAVANMTDAPSANGGEAMGGHGKKATSIPRLPRSPHRASGSVVKMTD